MGFVLWTTIVFCYFQDHHWAAVRGPTCDFELCIQVFLLSLNHKNLTFVKINPPSKLCKILGKVFGETSELNGKPSQPSGHSQL